MESLIENLMFRSRWILAPMYLGLVGGLVFLLIKFGQEFFHISMHIFSASEREVVLSVLNYGTRDLAGMTSNSFDELALERDLRDAILAFEPRIIADSLQVRLSRDAASDGKIAFEIDGQLWALPYAERVMFRTEMDLETGVCELSPI